MKNTKAMPNTRNNVLSFLYIVEASEVCLVVVGDLLVVEDDEEVVDVEDTEDVVEVEDVDVEDVEDDVDEDVVEVDADFVDVEDEDAFAVVDGTVIVTFSFKTR